MNKLKILCIGLLIPFFIFIPLSYIKMKHHEEFIQKTLLAKEIRKVLNHLMFDLRESHEKTFLDLPADGLWHQRIAFNTSRQGPLEYILKGGSLYRSNDGRNTLIAQRIGNLRIRHQPETPDIMEIEILAQNDVSLVSNLRIRIPE